MTDEEKINDYDRLQYEYAQIHQKYRRLSERQTPAEANSHPETKQLIIGDVSGMLPTCTNCGQELQLEVKEMTNKDIIDALQANNR